MATRNDIKSYANCRFYVQIQGINKAVFTEIEPITIETETEPYKEGGNNSFVHMLPKQTKVGNITFKFGLTNSLELYHWYLKIIQGDIDRRTVTVVVFDSMEKEVASWVFMNSFPVKWVGPPLRSDGTSVAIETLELTHEGLVINA